MIDQASKLGRARWSITSGLFATCIACSAALIACGNDATPQPASPTATTTSATAPTTSPPSSDAPAPTPTDGATGTATPAPTGAATTAPPATPPVQLPPSFVTAQNAFFVQADRLSDAVTTSAGDCAKLGAALEKIANDPAFGKAFKGYVDEAVKLKPEQRDAAKAAFDGNEKKFDALGDPIKTCEKNPRVKAAVDKMKSTFMASMKTLLKAFAGAMGGAEPGPVPPPPPPPRK